MSQTDKASLTAVSATHSSGFGSSGFGKKFVNLDNGALRENGVKDIKASVDYVVQAGVADPKRIGSMGGSYGLSRETQRAD